jgi:hypothetical protein
MMLTTLTSVLTGAPAGRRAPLVSVTWTEHVLLIPATTTGNPLRL